MDPPDLYEERYMRGSGVVLYRERVRMSRLDHAAMLGSIALLAPLALIDVSGAVVTFALLGTWALFTHVRVVVDTEAVRLQCGPSQACIAVGDIVGVEVIPLGWKEHIALWRRTSSFTAGQSGQAVRVGWRAPGGVRHAVVSSARAEELAAAIRRASGHCE